MFLNKGDNVLTLPAIVQNLSHTGIDGAVAHGDKHVVQLELQPCFMDCLPFYHTAVDRIVIVLSIAEQNHHGIVELDHLHLFVVYKTHNGEGGISHAAPLAHRKRGRDGGHAVVNAHAGRHHGGYDF